MEVSSYVAPRSRCLVSRTVTLFASREMEAGSLVSCREDISTLFPEQTPCAKYKVGFLDEVGRSVAGTLFTLTPVTHTYCPLLGFKRPVFLRETSARGWKLLLQSPLLRTHRVNPTQCQSFAEVSCCRCCHSSKLEVFSTLRWSYWFHFQI